MDCSWLKIFDIFLDRKINWIILNYFKIDSKCLGGTIMKIREYSLGSTRPFVTTMQLRNSETDKIYKGNMNKFCNFIAKRSWKKTQKTQLQISWMKDMFKLSGEVLKSWTKQLLVEYGKRNLGQDVFRGTEVEKLLSKPAPNNGLQEKLTNHSVRKPSIPRLLKSGVLVNYETHLNGKYNVKSLESYKSASIQYQRRISFILIHSAAVRRTSAWPRVPLRFFLGNCPVNGYLNVKGLDSYKSTQF